MKKGLKIFLIIIGILIGLIVIVNIVAGPVVKAYVEKHSEELCHRKVTMKHVRINLLTGKVAIIGLQAKEENGKDKFISFKKLKVRVSLPRLLGKTVRINRILLDGLDGHVVQDGIRFNFSDIIDFYTKDTKPKKEPSKWKVDIHRIHVKNCDVLYEDLRMGSRFDSRDVDIKVPRLRLKGGVTKLKMYTAFHNAGNVTIDGGYDIQKGNFDARVIMHDLSMSLGWPYLHKLVNLGSLTGKLSGDAKLKGHVTDMDKMVFSGSMMMDNVKALNADKTPLVSFSSFDAYINNADLGKKEFEIKELSLNGLQVNLDVYADGNSISRLKGGSAAELVETATETESSAVKPVEKVMKPVETTIRYKVKKLSVNQGKVLYADHSVAPQAQLFAVSDINIQADNLSNDRKSPITLSAKLGSSGELNCKAQINPFDLRNAMADISIKNLNIKDFNPYSLYYLAYPVEDGLLAFNSEISIKDKMLDSHNNLDIYKPTFGKKDKSIKPAATKIPMRTAMYLITDRKGHVKMELPVQGDVSSPEFSFRKVIWKTFLNLIVKIAASPVDFIAKAAGGDDTFKPMLVPVDNPEELDIERTHQLNALAEWLKEKDEVTLLVSITPHAESGLSAKAASDAVKRCFNVLQNHLVQQGIAAKRVMLTDEKKDHKSKGKLKIEFGLNCKEE